VAGATPATNPQPARNLLSIGQVLQRLNPEFPDLSPSKLRFLEDRDLVKPGRTPAGYRTYSHSDVERLRFILGVQRDHYLPLKVIKSYLDDLDAGGSPELPGVSRVLQPVAVGRVNALERKELVARSGASNELVDEAIAQGLVSPGPLFDQHQLRVIESLVQAEAFGLTPRHLRGLGQAVAREVDLVCHAVDAKSEKNAQAKRSQRELQRELADIVQQLRVALVRQALEGLES
jgi:DNA-binding transcriptional MerR regulator